MKRLLRCKDSGKFLKADGWTQSRDEATDFGSFGQAVDFCLKNSLANVEVVLAFPDPTLDVTIPVPNARK